MKLGVAVLLVVVIAVFGRVESRAPEKRQLMEGRKEPEEPESEEPMSEELKEDLNKDDPSVCPPGALSLLYIRPQCCGIDVLALLDLDCQSPAMPVNSTNFREVCQQRTPACCTVPVNELGVAVACRKANIK